MINLSPCHSKSECRSCYLTDNCLPTNMADPTPPNFHLSYEKLKKLAEELRVSKIYNKRDKRFSCSEKLHVKDKHT